MNCTRGFACLLAAAALAVSAFAADTGSISGTIIDDQGRAVADATMLYHSVQPAVRTASGGIRLVGRVVSSQTVADSRGQFRIDVLPAGDYALCALGVQPNQLQSCEWYGEYALVHVAEGQAVTGVTRTLRTGVLIYVDIQDLGGRMSGITPPLKASVRSDKGVYSNLSLISQDPSALHFRTVVPKGMNLRLLLNTPLTLTDAAGNVVAPDKPGIPLVSGQGPEVHVALVAK